MQEKLKEPVKTKKEIEKKRPEPLDFIFPSWMIDWAWNKKIPKIIRFLLFPISCILWLPFMMILFIPVFLWELWLTLDEDL